MHPCLTEILACNFLFFFLCFLWCACACLYIVTLLIYLICRIHHEKRWAGRSTSWNQDCWRNINNLRYADDTTLMAESEEELKSLLMKVKSKSEVTQLCPTPSHPMDCSLSGSSIHGIFQAKVLERVAIRSMSRLYIVTPLI